MFIQYLHKLRIRNNEDGATAIEFALIAPLLFVLIIATLEFGLVAFANNVIENATAEASRYGITGSDYAGGATLGINGGSGNLSREDVIKSAIRQRAGTLLDEDRISITCESLGSNFENVQSNQPTTPGAPASSNGNTPANGDCGASGLGGGDDAVIYFVQYNWPIFTPVIGNIRLFQNNEYLIRSALVVKNEAF